MKTVGVVRFTYAGVEVEARYRKKESHDVTILSVRCVPSNAPLLKTMGLVDAARDAILYRPEHESPS